MTFTQLLLVQLLAHILTDFTFQSYQQAKDKNEKGFKSKFLKWHILIMFLSSWILSFQWKFVFASLFIALTHWLVDGLKPYLNQNKWLGKYAFFIDQGLHLFFLAISVVVYDKWFALEPIIDMPLSEKWLAIVLVFVFCGKTCNVFIKEIFQFFDIKVGNTEDLPNAGRLIGLTERWLILVFVFINQFAAVGFLLASKSILRYKSEQEEGFNKTEYVLIGTLLSFGLGIGSAILVQLLFW
ncbi:DUF3307 domain-containing protein [Flagellimonas lutaonensis]|uniref:DUF3307 domain-containing protein n=1 Tax=Flagellimonas lutaonensis TaxID=516051 RepID=A0A0D5YVY2_9FLAO|nr:DUF3307 domain-containing protein [Allomuricauda lutaonensis]AKA36405.1 hypothetical protein VC82_2859 [Allomuricauda lutaonensis]